MDKKDDLVLEHVDDVDDVDGVKDSLDILVETDAQCTKLFDLAIDKLNSTGLSDGSVPAYVEAAVSALNQRVNIATVLLDFERANAESINDDLDEDDFGEDDADASDEDDDDGSDDDDED